MKRSRRQLRRLRAIVRERSARERVGLERAAAKERQAEGQKSGGRGHKKLGDKFTPSKGKVRNRIGEREA